MTIAVRTDRCGREAESCRSGDDFWLPASDGDGDSADTFRVAINSGTYLQDRNIRELKCTIETGPFPTFGKRACLRVKILPRALRKGMPMMPDAS